MKKSFRFHGERGNLVLERRLSERRDGRSQGQHGKSGKSLNGNVRSINKCYSF